MYGSGSECKLEAVSGGTAMGGEFWVPDNPGHRVRGEFEAEYGSDAEVLLDQGLVDDPRVVRTPNGFGLISSVEASVEAFQPIVIFGHLDSGEMVTLHRARNNGGHYPFGKPRYVADVCFTGAHLADTNQAFDAVRARIGHWAWLAHLRDGESATVPDDKSTLRAALHEDGNWLEYISIEPVTLRQLEERVIYSCAVLVELATYCKVSTREVELRIGGEGSDWISVHGSAVAAKTHEFSRYRRLLPSSELTVQIFAEWIALNDTLDGLSAAVAHKNTGPLQEAVLIVASLVEGLHRRLGYRQLRFPSTPKEDLRRIEKAARQSAGTEAELLGNIDRRSSENAVVFLREIGFRTRVADVVDEVCAVVPEIVESVPDFTKLLYKARNELAHHSVADEQDDPFEVRVLRWIVASTVTHWLLRCLLLLRAGIAPETLRHHILEFQRFQMFRANSARHAKELGWEL